MLRDYPSTPALEDDAAIAQLVAVAREKGRGSSDDPYSAMKPSSFTGGGGGAGGGGASGGGASGGGAGETKAEVEEKSEKSTKESESDSSRPKKGFFGIFS